MILLLDEIGAFWGGYDDLYGFMGANVLDLVQELLVGSRSRHLDRVVGD